MHRIFAALMKYSVIPVARAIVDHCKQRGIENVVISPGSRNAPLTLGFTSDPFFKCFSIVDERSAAFFALGIAQQIRRPVVVLCTSGSALLNYYPAVAEAFYSDLPLVVISADRPSYKIDVGDGQTIRQDRVFDRHIGYSTHLKQDVIHATEEMKRWGVIGKDCSADELRELQSEIEYFNNEQLNLAFSEASKNSPIHINVPFEEPLYDLLDEEVPGPFVEVQNLSAVENQIDWETIRNTWDTSRKILVIVGVQHPGVLDDQILSQLAHDAKVVVLTETTSNMRKAEYINSIDSVIAPVELAAERDAIFKQLRPELLISIGGLIVSKKIKAFLRQWQPLEHWHIDDKKAYNTFLSLTRHIETGPAHFFDKVLVKDRKEETGFKKLWSDLNAGQKKWRNMYLDQIEFSDLLAFNLILEKIPSDYLLQLANSSTVRYAQLFDLNEDQRVFCNRGTSGIDGSTSTAVGAAHYMDEPTLLISGDLSFLYDINGLWNGYVRPDFRMIVINNGGGGIFRILPGRKEDENFERYFETTHEAQLVRVCELFDLEHQLADDVNSLQRELPEFFKSSSRPKLLEVKTPRTLNDKVLLGYFEFISSKLYS